MGLRTNIKAGRNDLCPCGSGLKFKFCHGDEQKIALCRQVVGAKMLQLIFIEKKKRGLIPCKYKCNGCGKGFDIPQHSELNKSVLKCPLCDDTRVELDEEYAKLEREARAQQEAVQQKSGKGSKQEENESNIIVD